MQCALPVEPTLLVEPTLARERPEHPARQPEDECDQDGDGKPPVEVEEGNLHPGFAAHNSVVRLPVTQTRGRGFRVVATQRGTGTPARSRAISLQTGTVIPQVQLS